MKKREFAAYNPWTMEYEFTEYTYAVSYAVIPREGRIEWCHDIEGAYAEKVRMMQRLNTGDVSIEPVVETTDRNVYGAKASLPQRPPAP